MTESLGSRPDQQDDAAEQPSPRQPRNGPATVSQIVRSERPDLETAPRIVVTGGAGFLGSWLCDAALDKGYRVVCFDNFATGTNDNIDLLTDRPGFEFFEGDVCAGLQVGGPVDIVFHLASPASPPQYLRLPVETLKVGSVGTLNALELARGKKARFLLASTSEVYGDPLEHPQRETYFGNVNPVGPRAVYDEAKRFAEALTVAYRTKYGVDTAIARIFNTFGPRMLGDDGRVVPTFLTQALTNSPLTVFGDGSQTRSICYVTDTIAGLLALAESEIHGPVNIGNPTELTVLQLAERIKEITGSRSSISFVGLPIDDPKVRCPDITLARTELGWEPQVSVDEGLKLAAEWLESTLDLD